MYRRQRCSAANTSLLPFVKPRNEETPKHVIYPDVYSWTFGRGSVIWTIWPAVLIHTAFASVVTSVSLKTEVSLVIPPVLTTVLGVVIAFVISYRVSSGYDRYWDGRTLWNDLIKTSRTMARLIWIHVPLHISNDTYSNDPMNAEKCMQEKLQALDLIAGFAVAVKHHLRGEAGIYYEDLYHLVRPLHKHPHLQRKENKGRTSEMPLPSDTESLFLDPSAPLSIENAASRNSSQTHYKADEANLPFLLPASPSHAPRPKILIELIPFVSFFAWLCSAFHITRRNNLSFLVDSTNIDSDRVCNEESKVTWRFSGPSGRKYRPTLAGEGRNIPLQILWCLSERFVILDERNVVSFNALPGIYSCLTTMSDCLTGLEQILTTPLPFVYSAQILQCVWLYLFLLPFQIVEDFRWYTIPAVTIAAFFFLGFCAAAEELEQPFGYDENDLDLDLFCHDIIRADIEALKHTCNPNVMRPKPTTVAH